MTEKKKVGRPYKTDADKAITKAKRNKRYRDKERKKKMADTAKKLPRMCVEIEVRRRDTAESTYAVPPLVRFRKPAGMEAPEIIERIEDCEADFVDWMLKEFRVSERRTDVYCAALRRLHDKKAKDWGRLDSWKKFEASIKRDGEEKE